MLLPPFSLVFLMKGTQKNTNTQHTHRHTHTQHTHARMQHTHAHMRCDEKHFRININIDRSHDLRGISYAHTRLNPKP